MPKPSDPPTKTELPRPEAAPRDWFQPAIEHDGPVSACLDSVLGELGFQAQFVETIKRALQGAKTSGCDAVTELSGQVKSLENTLRFRLGVLRPERPAAWFRAQSAATTGPFAKIALEEPVFAGYDASEVATVRQGLSAAWRECRTYGLPFIDGMPCLWRTLLSYNATHAALCQLPAPFSALRLDKLPDGLPPLLESRSLRAFLLNVKAEVMLTRERLDGCFALLFTASEKLWTLQEEANDKRSAFTKKAEQAKASPDADSEFDWHSKRARTRVADDLREEFKMRRTRAAAYLTPNDIDAMRFMGFEELPSSESLRQRYLAMAKKLHPDLQGGSDQAFKTLSGAYAHLLGRLT